MRKAVKGFILIIGGLISVLLFVELFHYFNRSYEKAQAEAVVSFNEECIRRKVDPSQFGQPKMRILEGSSLEFRWDMKNEKKTIFVLVEYLPEGTESWFVE